MKVSNFVFTVVVLPLIKSVELQKSSRNEIDILSEHPIIEITDDSWIDKEDETTQTSNLPVEANNLDLIQAFLNKERRQNSLSKDEILNSILNSKSYNTPSSSESSPTGRPPQKSTFNKLEIMEGILSQKQTKKGTINKNGIVASPTVVQSTPAEEFTTSTSLPHTKNKLELLQYFLSQKKKNSNNSGKDFRNSILNPKSKSKSDTKQTEDLPKEKTTIEPSFSTETPTFDIFEIIKQLRDQKRRNKQEIINFILKAKAEARSSTEQTGASTIVSTTAGEVNTKETGTRKQRGSKKKEKKLDKKTSIKSLKKKWRNEDSNNTDAHPKHWKRPSSDFSSEETNESD